MSQSSLLKTKRFFPLFLTQFGGVFNDYFLKGSIIALVTIKSISFVGLSQSDVLALSGFLFILPVFLFSATAGQLADKYEKTLIIKIVKLAELGIMALATLGFLTNHYGLLMGALFLMGLHSTAFGPVKYSILPELLNDNEIVGGTALIEAGTFLAIFLGAIVGGALITYEPQGPLYVSIGLLILAVIGYVSCLKIPKGVSKDPTLKIDWTTVAPTIAMIKALRSKRQLFYTVSAISWFSFFSASVLYLFPLYAENILHSDQSIATSFLALFSIGIAVGAMLCEMMSRKMLDLGLVPLGSIGMSIFAADLFFTGTPEFVVKQANHTWNVIDFFAQAQGLRIGVDLFMMSVFCGFFIVPLYTLIQIRSEPKTRSRVVAANNFLNALYLVASALIMIAFTKLSLNPAQIFFVIAAMNFVVATFIYLYMPEFLYRFYLWIITRIMYRFKVVGHQYIPREGPAVLICNHVSFVDWMVVSAGIKRPLRFVMDHNFYKSLIGRTFFNQAKVIPIASAKENPELLEKAFSRIADELSKGSLVCIFPEGQITSDGQLGLFKPGIEKIIARSPVPVIPMALCNLWGSFFSREGGRAIKKVPRRFWSAIELRIEPPITPDGVQSEILRAKVQSMLNEYEKEMAKK